MGESESLSLPSAEVLDRDDPIAHIRQEFEIPNGVIYLDGNSLGALPRSVAQRVHRVIEDEWGRGLIRSWNSTDWYELPSRVGDRIAPLIGARPGEVVVGDSTSISLFRVVAAALTLRPGRNVIVTERSNFPTDLYILEGIKRMQPEIEIRQAAEGEDPTHLLDEQTALLVLTHVDYRTGHIRDMEALTQAAHRVGALAIWDLSHSTGIVPVSLNDSGADFAVGCGYKYLNGGPGAPSHTWVAPKHADRVEQPLAGWLGHRDPFAFTPEYVPAPRIRRFITGTQQVLSLSALDEAMKVWEHVEIAHVRAKSIAQTSRFIAMVEAQCAGLGVTLVSPRDPDVRGGHVSFAHEHGYAVMQALIERGVIGDFRAPNLLRFGFSPLYLRFEEIDQAAAALADVLRTRSWDAPRFTERRRVT
ncbi:MAG: kynureninase [Candidatus Limnocylindrus sp.]